MNAIVVVALKRPYTFVVLAIAILLYGIMSILKSPTDVFPNIRIPVVAVVWSYAGLLPEDVSGRITFYYERQLTSTVEGLDQPDAPSQVVHRADPARERRLNGPVTARPGAEQLRHGPFGYRAAAVRTFGPVTRSPGSSRWREDSRCLREASWTERRDPPEGADPSPNGPTSGSGPSA